VSEWGDKVIISNWPGIGLLDMAFEESGFCVVRGPDKLWGGDVRRFHIPPGVFWGMIGGPPCQEFSGLFRGEPTGYGLEMLAEYVRLVEEGQPEWFLMENVARVPDIEVAGYVTQRFDINQGWYCDVSRLRHIQFGSKSGRLLNVTRRRVTEGAEPAALASDSRGFDEVKRLQGLPADFDLPPFKVVEKVRAVGNGVPLPMGRALVAALIEAYSQPATVQLTLDGSIEPARRCACGCGREVTGKAEYYDYSCRKRAQRKRDRSMRHR
jgi:DNA (cytosine-5)-methyltransferase 1